MVSPVPLRSRRIRLLPVAAALLVWSAGALAAGPGEKVARVTFVLPETPSTSVRGVETFWAQLRELGWVEGRNLVKETRSAEGRIERLPEIMAEAVAGKPDVLVTMSTPGAIAASHATRTIPIVVAAMGDPIVSGVAASLGHPGGNVTGLSLQMTDFAGKWLELLKEAVPALTTVAVVGNPEGPLLGQLKGPLESAAAERHIKLRFIEARAPEQFDGAFAQAKRHAGAVLVIPDPVTVHNREKVVSAAARYRVPTMYGLYEFVYAGGLMSYGVDQIPLLRRAAIYVDKILRGAKPGELPFEQPTQFGLAINLKTARALKLRIPESLLLRANEVVR